MLPWKYYLPPELRPPTLAPLSVIKWPSKQEMTKWWLYDTTDVTYANEIWFLLKILVTCTLIFLEIFDGIKMLFYYIELIMIIKLCSSLSKRDNSLKNIIYIYKEKIAY